MFPAVIKKVSLVECVLLEKLFYGNKGLVSLAVRDYNRLKIYELEESLLNAMIIRSDETGKLGDQHFSR